MSKPALRQGDSPRADRRAARVWTEGALELLARAGPDAIRIEPLARYIGVSKGSFYWFFGSRDDLLASVLQHWRTDYNDVVFATVEGREGPLRIRLDHLIETVRRSDLGRFDAAIRAWSLRDRTARACVDAVDRDRLAFLTRLFGDPPPAMRAQIFYRAFISESYVSAPPGGPGRNLFLRQVADYLVAAPPMPQPIDQQGD